MFFISELFTLKYFKVRILRFSVIIPKFIYSQITACHMWTAYVNKETYPYFVSYHPATSGLLLVYPIQWLSCTSRHSH